MENTTFDASRLVLIGHERDFDPRDLDEMLMGCPGSFFDDVYMDTQTKKLYVDCYMAGGYKEYTSLRPIMYVK